MTHVHYADMFITLMLGWVRGVTNWIWSMIRLGQGSSGRSFLAWFSNNWVKLVVVLMLACVAMDWLVWLVRWRPYWLWFGKKRRIVNDTEDPAPVRKKEAPVRESERRAPAPQFHSVALPRRKQPAADDLFTIEAPAAKPAPDDLFAVEKTPARIAEKAPQLDDLFSFDEAPKAARRASADDAAKPERKRSNDNDAIDWFE